MVDVGVINFVKNALAQGKTKEQITAELARGRWSQADVDAAFSTIQNSLPPTLVSAATQTPPTIIQRFFDGKWKWGIIVIVLLMPLIGGAVYFGKLNFSALISNTPVITFNATLLDVSNWNTYSNQQYGFYFKYPSELTARDSVYTDKYGPALLVTLQTQALSGNVISNQGSIGLAVRPKAQANLYKTLMGNIRSQRTVTVNGLPITIYSSVIVVTAGNIASSTPMEYAEFQIGDYAYLLSANQAYSDDVYTILSTFTLGQAAPSSSSSPNLGIPQNSPLGAYGSLSTYCGNGQYPKDPSTLPNIGCFALSYGHTATGTFLNHIVKITVSATGTVDLFVDGLMETDNPYVHQTGVGYNLCNDTKGTSCPTSFQMITHDQNSYLFDMSQCLPPNYHTCVMTQENWDYEVSHAQSAATSTSVKTQVPDKINTFPSGFFVPTSMTVPTGLEENNQAFFNYGYSVSYQKVDGTSFEAFTVSSYLASPPNVFNGATALRQNDPEASSTAFSYGGASGVVLFYGPVGGYELLWPDGNRWVEIRWWGLQTADPTHTLIAKLATLTRQP